MTSPIGHGTAGRSIPIVNKLRQAAKDWDGEPGDLDVLILDAADVIEWIATALPVLKTMCNRARLVHGEHKAQEMIDYLESVTPPHPSGAG